MDHDLIDEKDPLETAASYFLLVLALASLAFVLFLPAPH